MRTIVLVVYEPLEFCSIMLYRLKRHRSAFITYGTWAHACSSLREVVRGTVLFST